MGMTRCAQMTGSGTLVCHDSPALPAAPVTLRNGRLDSAFPGAVTGFTASQGVEVEGVHLTDFTLGPDCAGRTEAFPRHPFTKAAATVASCRGTKRHCIRVGLYRTGISWSSRGVWGHVFLPLVWVSMLI